MAQDQASAPNGSSDALYGWWLNALPAAFGASIPAAGNAGGGGSGALPFPIDRMADALGPARALLDALYGGYLRALVASHPGDELRAFEELVQGRVSGIVDKLASFAGAWAGRPDPAALGIDGAPLAAIGEALKPLALNIERTYGGLADAFGLAPLRELQEASKDMALATVAHRRAQAEYLDVVAGALGQGAERLVEQLTEMGRRGESVDTLLALVRLWARSTDAAMHIAMQTPRALKASAELIRAATRSRRQQQRVVGIASTALGIPTRAEMDEAYREIQMLKRELRRSRKGAVAQADAESAAPPAKPASRTRSPRKKAAAS